MAKGGGYEREFCKKLSLWWTGGESDSIFWRTSNSGGRATVRYRKNAKTKNQHGDVCATDLSGQPMIDAFCIELKRGYSRSTLFDLFDKGPKAKVQQYEAWIAKTILSAEASGSLGWMLVTRRDQRLDFVVIPSWMWRQLKSDDDTKSGPLPFVKCELDLRIGNSQRRLWVVGMLLTDWFERVMPFAIERILLGAKS